MSAALTSLKASIDTETEMLIQDGLRHLMQGRTSILIAHRLQTIQEADHVLVLEQGVVREYGSHQALIDQGGLYKTLHDLQFQDIQNPSEDSGEVS